MNWNEVIKKPGFSDLDPAQQDIVRQRWVDEVYLPQATKAGWSADDVAALRQEQLTGYDNGQGYVSSFASSVGRGVAGSVSGLIGGAGAILDSPDLTETADSMDAAVGDYLPVNPSMKYTNLAGQAVGQAGSLLATGGVAGGIGKAIGGLRAGTVAAEAAVLGSGGISEARDAAREADQYGMTGEERAMKIASGVLTGIGTEYLPFGLGTETAAVKRLLGAGEKAVGKRTAGLAGDVATEAAEESIGQVANNAFTQALAPEGVETPGLTSGLGDAAFGGAIGGATFGAANSLTRPNTPPAAPPAAAANGTILPAPAGFTATGVPGRASAMGAPVAAPAPGITEEELAALEVPPERVAIVAGAIATSSSPAVEAEVIQTAQIAASLHAQKTAQTIPPPVATPADPAAVPVPVVPGEHAAPEVDAAAVEEPRAVAPGAMVRLTFSPVEGTEIKTSGTVTALNKDGTATVKTARDGLVTVPAAGLQVFGALPQPTAEQAAAANKKQAGKRRFTADPGAYPLVTAIVEAGISPRNPAAQLATARANRRESLSPTQQTIMQKDGGYNDLPKVSEFAGRPRAQDAIRKMFRNGTSNTPDQALQQAATYANRDATEFYGNTAWQEIRDELMRLDGDATNAATEDDRMDELERQAIEFYAAIGEGEFKLDVASLEPGDVLVVEGEELKVKATNRDANGDVQSVELQDGKRFGRQEIDGTTALFVEEFQEEDAPQAIDQPEPDQPAPSVESISPAVDLVREPVDSVRIDTNAPSTPAPEVTADGQRDMLAGRDDEPFNLTAESPADRRAREARELAEANAARTKKNAAARKALEEATPELPLSEPSGVEQWADKTIAESRGKLLSGVPDPTLLAAYAVKGSILIARGIRDFAKWSKAMLDEFGEAISPHLNSIFTEANANDGKPLETIPTALPSPPDAPGLFEKWFGNKKKLVSDTKEYEARNATRAALEVPLFVGIDDSHTPGIPLEEAIGSLTPAQRVALHDRVVSDLSRMTGTVEEAAAYAAELRAYVATVPELAGQKNISTAALQYTNLVQVAAALSGIHGQTAAFATIINTDNDQLRFDAGTASLLRSDLGRLLGSQSGIGARIAEFARIIATTNNDGLKRLGLTDDTIAALGDAIANKTLTANEIEAIFAESTTSPQGPLIESALAKLQRLVDAAAAVARPLTEAEKAARAATRLGQSILGDAIGPLVPKLPIGKIVKAFMAAPAHHRNSAAWRQLQITNWLTENGVDAALAARLTVNMDEIVAKVMANLIYQEQEKYVIGKKGVGTQAVSNSEFAKRFRDNKDAIRSAIRVGLMTDGTPWQAWFSSVTGIQPLTAAEQSQIAAWETILSGDRYFPSEKGVAAAKLRDLMDARFGKDVSGWELLAASYDASALSSGTTMAVQFAGPVGKLMAVLTTDMASMVYRPSSAVDVMDSFLASVETYAAELPNAFRYDTGGNFAADSAMKMGDVAPLKKDMAKQRAVLANPKASMAAKGLAMVRFIRSAQDYLRQAMNAADSAAVAGFQRYFETREVRRIMRAAGISKGEVAATMKADGFTSDAAELQADALGYDGTLKKRFVGDAMWARWKEIVTAHANTPEEHKTRLAALLADTEAEAEFSAFVGNKRDRSTPFDPTDWALGGIQSIGERLFADARKRVETGEKASGSVQRIILRSVLGFVGIPLNAARAAMWYSPFSLLSFANYAAWKKGIGYKENPYERSLGNAIQVRQRIKESITGNTILLVAIAALKGLQEEDDWKINGYGPDPSKHPEEAKAWRRLHVPFSIEKTENGKAINLPFQRGTLEPLKAPLMMLAGWSDATMDSKLAKEAAPDPGNQVLGALRQLGLSSITTGMRNIGGMRDALQRGMDGGTLGSQAGFVAAPLIPYSGTERWIRQWNNPEQLEKGFMNNLPFAHYREDARPALNLFGQKLRPDPSTGEMMSRQFSGLPPGYSRPISPEDEKLHGWMQRTGKQPTAYSRLDVEKKILRTVTDDEWYAYSLAAGKVRHDQLTAAIDGTLPIERTVKIPGPQPDKKIKAPMKKGLAGIDPADKEAMKQAGAILEDIGAEAHQAGLDAIGVEPAEKAKVKKKPAPAIF